MMPTRVEAQERTDAIAAFRKELQRLEGEGIVALTADQQRAIDAYHQQLLARLATEHDVDRSDEAKELSVGMRFVSFLGALALSASVYFLFHQYWGQLATATQVAILTVAATGTTAGTFVVHRHDRSGYFTSLAALVAIACFVLDTVMIGRIFAVTPSDLAIAAWAGLALTLAYACNLRLPLAIGVACAIAVVAGRLGPWDDVFWMLTWRRPETIIVAGALAFAIPALIDHGERPAFSSIYRGLGITAILAAVLALSRSGRASALIADETTIETVYELLGFLVAAAAIWVGLRRRWRETTTLGTAFFGVFLLIRFTDWWWEVLPRYQFFLLIGLTAVLMLFTLRRLRVAADASLSEVLT